MSDHQQSGALTVFLAPSAWMGYWLITVHVLAFLVILNSTLAFAWQWLVTVGLLLSLIYGSQKYVLGLFNKSVIALRIDEYEQWSVWFFQQSWQGVSIMDQQLFWSKVIILFIEDKRGQRYKTLIFADQLLPEEFKKLYKKLLQS